MWVGGGLNAKTIRFENTTVARTVSVRGIIQRDANDERVGVCIEEPFSG
jgi:hypothetical protein